MISEKEPTFAPLGIFTFLFTDIEGSTVRWESEGEVMARALARHDVILRNAIERHGGTVFKTVGDAFCAVFSDVSAALDASLEGQHDLEAERWPPNCHICVRMAIHSGSAEERDGDYFGPTLNRIARLLSAGYGGQVLLSGATHELVQDRIPREVQLSDLGEHYLRDLGRPEHVYQVTAPGLRSHFPALKTLHTRANNLPTQLTSFVGRDRERGQVRDLLTRPDVRLLTLTGPGGTGKTRLAIQVATDLLDQFRDGAFLVSLAAVTQSELIASSIAGALGLDVRGDRVVSKAVTSFLQEKQMLLILDNLEQLDGAAPILADLLTSCPELTMLVTSREVLHLYGEHVIVVTPMATPDPTSLPSIDSLSAFDAIALFLQRAQAARSDFVLNDGNARDVVEICLRLDGLPLAIELAAARIRLFPPHALLPRLSNRLKLLTGGGRDLPSRQQTLRGAIEWSYALLDPDEQELFACLAVFAGGSTLEAAEAVCGGRIPDVLEEITSLTEKSLMREEGEPDGEPRFGMLESIREYAAERLDSMSGADILRSNHATYYAAGLELWDEADSGNLSKPELVARLDEEQQNLTVAWEWLRLHDTSKGLVLGCGLARYWGMRGRWGDIARWTDDVQETGDVLPPPVRTKVLDIAGLVIETYGDHERALLLYDQSYALRRESGDPTAASEALAFRAWKAISEGDTPLARELFAEGFAAMQEMGTDGGTEDALKWLGATAQYLGMYDRAEGLAQRGLVLARRRGSDHDVAARLGDLGDIALKQGDVARAAPFFEESLRLRRALNDLNCIPHSLEGLGRVALLEGDPERARSLLGERLEMSRRSGSPSQVARSLTLMGHAEVAAGDLRRAGGLFRESLRLADQIGEPASVADALWGLVAVASGEGASARAVRLGGAVTAMQRASGGHIPPVDQGRNTAYLEKATAGLEDDSRDRLWREGSEMSAPQAVAYALESDT